MLKTQTVHAYNNKMCLEPKDQIQNDSRYSIVRVGVSMRHLFVILGKSSKIIFDTFVMERLSRDLVQSLRK
ncbi:hypothetical protein YC2023_034880 [Brassica napus]